MALIPLRHFYIGDWKVDVAHGEISKRGRCVHLEPKVMQVLAFMATRGNEVVLKDELINDIWRNESVGDASLTRCISTLRQALGDDARAPIYIKTVPKVGFRIVAKVSKYQSRPDFLAAAIAATIAAAFVVFFSVSTLSSGTKQPLSGFQLTISGAEFETPIRRVLSYQLTRSVQDINNGFSGQLRKASHVIAATLSEREGQDILELSIQAIDANDEPRVLALPVNEQMVTSLPDEVTRLLMEEYNLLDSEGFERPSDSQAIDSFTALNLYVHGIRRLESDSPQGYLEAIPFFRDAIDASPNFGAAYAGLSLALVTVADHGDAHALVGAEEAARSALKYAPNDAISYLAIGDVLDSKNQTGEALVAFDTAMSIDRSMWHAAYGAARIHYRQQQFDEAKTLFRQALNYNGNHGPSMTGLGDTHLRMGNVDDAIKWLELALDHDPRYPMAISRLATAYLVSGDIESAISHCEKIADVYPRYDRCLYVLSAAYLANGQHGLANDALDSLIENDPTNGYAILGKAQVELAQSADDDAEELVKQVLKRAIAAAERDPDEWRNYWLAAAAYSLLGDNDNAFVWLDRVRSSGRQFYLWDAMDPAFRPLRNDSRFERYLASTQSNSQVFN